MTTIYAQDGGTGTGTVASSPANFATVIAGYGGGDVIVMTGDCTMPEAFTWTQNLTMRANTIGAYDADPLGDGGGPVSCRFTRTVTLIFPAGNVSGKQCMSYVADGVTLTLQNIAYWPDAWPGPGQTWENIGVSFPSNVISSDAGNLVMTGCEPYHGYGGTGEPYSVDTQYDEQRSPAQWQFVDGTNGMIDIYPGTGSGTIFTGWDQDPWSTYNPFRRGPGMIGGQWQSLLIESCYFHDACTVIRSSPTSTGSVIVRNNWVARWMIDGHPFNFNSSSFTGSIKIYQNIYQDALGQSKDAGNPHSDVWQSYSNFTTGVNGPPVRLPNIEIGRNFYFPSNRGTRGGPQFGFLQTSADHQKTELAYMDALKYRENVVIGAKKLLIGQGANYYMRNCIGVNPDWFPATVDSSNTLNVTPERTSAALTSNMVPNTRALVGRTIAETISAGPNINRSSSASTGHAPADLTPWFADPSDPVGDEWTPNFMWEKFRTVGDYEDYGPQYATLRDFLTGAVDWTGETAWLGLVNLTNLEASTEVETDLLCILGGDIGDSLTLGVPAGVEWEMVDNNLTTVLIARNAASSATVTVGKYLRFWADSGPAAQTVTYDIDIGSSTIAWSLTSMSDNVWPEVTLDGLHCNTKATEGLTGVSNSNYLNVALRASVTLSSTRTVGNLGTGGAISLSMGVSTTRSLLRKSGNVGVTGSGSGGSVVSGVPCTIVISVDLTQADSGDGYKIFINGVQQSISGVTWDPPVLTSLVEFAQSGAVWNLLATAGNVSGLDGSFSFLWISDQKVIWDDEQLGRLNPDYIGPSGQGIDYIDESDPDDPITVTDTSPPVFLLGVAGDSADGQLNVTQASGFNANRGTGGTFYLRSGASAAVEAVAAPWPPPLTLFVTDVSPGPYPDGFPILIQVAPPGYAKDGVTLTAASDKAGTWDDDSVTLPEGRNGYIFTFTPSETGVHTFSFTADSDYIAPDDFQLEVEGAFAYVEPGTTGNVLKESMEEGHFITASQPVGDNQGPARLRFRKGPGDSGNTGGVDLYFDVT